MVDCSIGTPCDPPLAGRRRGAGDVGHRAGLSRLGRQPAAARGRGGLAGPALRAGRGAAGLRRRLRGDQGARRLGAAPAPPARARTRTRCCTPPCRTRPTPWAPSWRGAAPSPVPAAPGRLGGLDLDAIDAADAARALRAVVELAVEPDRRPGRPRRGGGLGAGARRPGVLRRVLRRVHLGRPAALGAPARRRRRGRRALALQALEPGRRARRVLRRRRRAGRVPARRAPARRPHGARARPRPPAWRPWPTTSTSRPSGRATGSAWPSWPACSTATAARSTLPEGGFYLWVPVPAGPLARRVGDGRGAGHRRRAPGQPGRPLRRRPAPATCGWPGPADGAVGAGGGAPR